LICCRFGHSGCFVGIASQALLENAWGKNGLTGFGDHHDHDTQDDHDGRV